MWCFKIVNTRTFDYPLRHSEELKTSDLKIFCVKTFLLPRVYYNMVVQTRTKAQREIFRLGKNICSLLFLHDKFFSNKRVLNTYSLGVAFLNQLLSIIIQTCYKLSSYTFWLTVLFLKYIERSQEKNNITLEVVYRLSITLYE